MFPHDKKEELKNTGKRIAHNKKKKAKKIARSNRSK